MPVTVAMECDFVAAINLGVLGGPLLPSCGPPSCNLEVKPSCSCLHHLGDTHGKTHVEPELHTWLLSYHSCVGATKAACKAYYSLWHVGVGGIWFLRSIPGSFRAGPVSSLASSLFIESLSAFHRAPSTYSLLRCYVPTVDENILSSRNWRPALTSALSSEALPQSLAGSEQHGMSTELLPDLVDVVVDGFQDL